jgi:hypothetical protein
MAKIVLEPMPMPTASPLEWFCRKRCRLYRQHCSAAGKWRSECVSHRPAVVSRVSWVSLTAFGGSHG